MEEKEYLQELVTKFNDTIDQTYHEQSQLNNITFRIKEIDGTIEE